MNLSKTLKELVKKLSLVFELNFCSLALFRISIGIILLLDILSRAKYTELFLSDFGVLPRKVLIDSSDRWDWSLNMLSGVSLLQLFLVCIAIVFSLFLIFGYKTLISTFVCWVLVVSFQNRNPLINDGGDSLLRLSLFWSLFLPLGKVYSIDSLKATTKSIAGSVVSAGSAALIIQLCLMYLSSALLKSAPEWRSEGTAVYYALSLDIFARPLGKYLLNFPELLKFLSFATLIIEGFLPLLLFIPFYNSFLRLFVIAFFVCLHLGFAMTMGLGLFPLVCISVWLALLPQSFWDFVQSKLSKVTTIKSYIIKFSVIASSYWQKLIKKLSSLKPIIGTCVCISVLTFVFYVNLHSVNQKVFKIDKKAQCLESVLGLKQEWSMFAPFPMKEEAWYILKGKTISGRLMNMQKEKIFAEESDWEKPKDTCFMCKDQRYGNFYNKIFTLSDNMKKSYGQYLCRDWNFKHKKEEDKISEVEIYFMLEKTLPNNKTAPPEKKLLLTQKCQ